MLTMKRILLTLTLAVGLSSQVYALDVEWNSPADQTPATMILAAKALGIWDVINNQLVSGQVDAYGNLWSLYVEGLRYTCTGTPPVCTPKGDGYWVHMRYLGPISGKGTSPALTANITVGGTVAAPTFTWKGASPAPGSVTIKVDDHTHAGWM